MLNSPHAGQEKRNRGRNTVNASVDKIKLQIFTDCFERGKDRRKIYHCFYPISRRRSLYGKKRIEGFKSTNQKHFTIGKDPLCTVNRVTANR